MCCVIIILITLKKKIANNKLGVEMKSENSITP